MNRTCFQTILITGCATFCCAELQAAAVTNWHTFKASPATTLSGQGTANPIFGSVAETSAAGFLVGYLDSPLSLVNVGDRISFTFQVGFNDAAGMPTGAGDQFRFGLFDLNGTTRATADNTATAGVAGQTDNWLGYRYGVRSGAGTGSTGSIRERTTGVDLNPLANAQTTLLGSPTGDQVVWHSATNGVGGSVIYSGELTLELTPSGVNLSGFFRGNGTTNIFAFSDTATPFTSDFEAVAFLNGGSLSADQILFQNVAVASIVPEPSPVALLSLGLVGMFLFRLVQARRNCISA